MKKLAIATCLAVLFISGIGGAYAYVKTPVSYISLDINPSVELGVNAFEKVVKAEGYNNDGKKILNGINVTGFNVTKAVSILLSSAVDNGYIANDGSTVISLTSETNNINIAYKLITDAESAVSEALKENGKTAVIHKDTVPLSLHEEAKSLGITAGKLNLIDKLKEVDPNATVDQYKNASVKNIMQDIQNNTDNGSVNNKDNGAADNKDKDAVENKNNGAVDNKDEGAVNNKNEDSVENKNQTTDKVNTVNNTKSVKKDNASNSDNNSNNSGNNGNSNGNN